MFSSVTIAPSKSSNQPAAPGAFGFSSAIRISNFQLRRKSSSKKDSSSSSASTTIRNVARLRYGLPSSSGSAFSVVSLELTLSAYSKALCSIYGHTYQRS